MLMRPAPVLSAPGKTAKMTSKSVTKRPNSTMKASQHSTVTNWSVSNSNVRCVPSFYPLEKSSRFIDDSPANIASRISNCCRLLSVQAKFNDNLATADLVTEEHVEIHLTLWKAENSGATESDVLTRGVASEESVMLTIVEAQRRNGCSVIYHRYCRNLLDAAQGTFCLEDDHRKASCDQHPRLQVEKKGMEGENSLLALEIAASLLTKDRMDARRLGMESLCLLTDPSKTGEDTALLASQVVLFGTVQKANIDDDAAEFIPDELGIREAILSLVQFGSLGDYCDFEAEDSTTQIEDDSNQILHNLALAVLANALEVLETYGTRMMAPTDAAKPSANIFLEESKEMTKRELLASLLNVLGKAEAKPHDACLSAQCLRSLFQASKEAKRKAKDLNAKQIVMTALDVGQRTHVKLENETMTIIRVLERTETEDDSSSTLDAEDREKGNDQGQA